ncbi:MAG: 50S ribosomal protein L9 [Mycoplasmataceae bacterium RV_VA103A]|nr:MAG: 50S ribosomal protein L9 [Mycoplasmataceae bacterium RV_VA103A]
MKKREKVIFLQKNKWGQKYEVKELRRGFVVNYLLPRKEIRLANEKNLTWLEQKKVQQTQTDALLEVEAQKIYDKINNLSFDFTLKKDEKGEPFGSVGFKEILTSLEKVGFSGQKKQLLDFHSLNKLGENIIKVKLSNKIIANIRIIVK